MKVFFSHASEDKPLVEQVFLRVGKRFPEIQGWLDKYEILGGDDLIEKVHSGIESSDKFLIFLSPNSIDKPWVRTELRKALADEINGIKPEFIVPIKVGHISQFPPFLESRFYIDKTRPKKSGCLIFMLLLQGKKRGLMPLLPTSWSQCISQTMSQRLQWLCLSLNSGPSRSDSK